eukprot:6491140-Amphidinium_carterae.1
MSPVCIMACTAPLIARLGMWIGAQQCWRNVRSLPRQWSALETQGRAACMSRWQTSLCLRKAGFGCLVVLVAKYCCRVYLAGAPMDSPFLEAADVQPEAQRHAEQEPQTSQVMVKGGHPQTRKLPRVSA